MSVNFTIFTLCRLILAVSDAQCYWQECFEGPLILNKALFHVECVRLGSAVFFISIMPVVVFERFMATILLSSYEKKRFSFVTFLHLIIPIACTVQIVRMLENDSINIWLLCGTGEIACLWLVLGLLAVDYINQRRYKHSSTAGSNYTLSERFQLAENIRSGRLMRHSATVLVVGNAIIIACFAGIYLGNTFETKLIFKMAYDVSVNAVKICFSIITIKASHIWTEIFWRTLRKIRKRFTVKLRIVPTAKSLTPTASFTETTEKWRKHDKSTNFRTCTGKPMVFSVKEECDLYFDLYLRSWNHLPTDRPKTGEFGLRLKTGESRPKTGKITSSESQSVALSSKRKRPKLNYLIAAVKIRKAISIA
ncbi:sre G protein-coupled chemoreceptor domain-containing protein [Ditylenchus destructor]|nr:sre G protein-coupled chemoreceptor domain-containing protein [Ditylenchus destructor]